MPLLECWYSRSEPGDGLTNEDRLGHGQTAAWVFDGATGVAGHPLLPAASDAAWFVTAADAALRDALEGPEAGDAGAAEILERVLARVVQRFRDLAARVPEAHEVPSSAFAMIRVASGRLELSAIGDCAILYRINGGAVRRLTGTGLTAASARTLAAFQARRRAEPGVTLADLKRHLTPILQENRRGMNGPTGYPILTPDGSGLHGLITERIALPEGAVVEAMLASDGFLRLVDLFGVATDAALMAPTSRPEMDHLMDLLRTLEADDPEAHQFPRLKARDDASVARVRLQA